VELAGQLLDMGASRCALKDMAALLQPQPAYDIVKGIKDDLRRRRSTSTATPPPASRW
jgi:pyruvate/oxaloacetate carboxyltransferase